MAKATECGWCASPLPQQVGAGRPRTYCSDHCKSRAYEGRRFGNATLIEALGERDGWVCYLCGGGIDPSLTTGWAAPCTDHVVPTIWGGQTTPENLAAVHVRCNARKGSMLVPHPSWGDPAA